MENKYRQNGVLIFRQKFYNSKRGIGLVCARAGQARAGKIFRGVFLGCVSTLLVGYRDHGEGQGSSPLAHSRPLSPQEDAVVSS